MILVIIIAVTILISYKGFNDLSFFRKFEFHIGSIHQGEQIRMISSGFLHVDMGHLFFNMITLWFFAPLVLSYLGNWTFILIYMGSLIFGNLLTYVFNKNNYTYRAVGASGAVTGVLYSAILLQPDMMLGLFFVIPIPAYLFGILYLLYSIYGMKSQNDNIGHSAHFGGAVGGYIITLIEQPQLLVDHTMMVVLLTIPIIVLFIMQRLGKL
jgi:membrane associated rhomboid family serine protease